MGKNSEVCNTPVSRELRGQGGWEGREVLAWSRQTLVLMTLGGISGVSHRNSGPRSEDLSFK